MSMSVCRSSRRFLALLLLCSLVACGDGAGTSTTGAPTAGSSMPPPFAAAGDANAVPIYVDGGISSPTQAIPNAIYTDIEICAPGSSNCAVIQHVLVDTGSVGLRVLASAIRAANATLLGALPQASGAAAGSVVGECLPFVSGVTWGGVRSVDLHWGGSDYGGELASNIPLQVIGDADARVAAPPSSCTRQGSLLKTATALGGNGIVGIGLFAQDCGSYCAQNVAPIYFQCTGRGACSAVAMPASRQIPNPVAAMAADNNGSLISLPAGAAPRASGLLVLGIGTRLNNALPASSAILGTDDSGHFTASFNGNVLPRSFIDSGSSANFMPATGTIPLPPCASGPLAGTSYLCPAATQTLVSGNSGAAGTAATANVLIVNANSAVTSNPGGNVIPGLAAEDGSIGQSLDLGASFFFGRTVATLIAGRSAPGFPLDGPALGYTP